MRKALIFSTILISFLPFFALAQFTPGSIPEPSDYGIKGAENIPTNSDDLLDILRSVVKFVYIAFFIIAVLFIVIAAFNYLTGADAPDKIKAAHTQLVYSIIAIGIALLALTLQVVVGSFIKNTGGSTVQENQIQSGYQLNDGSTMYR